MVMRNVDCAQCFSQNRHISNVACDNGSAGSPLYLNADSLAKFPLRRKSDKDGPEVRVGQIPGFLHSFAHPIPLP